jgi:hypothetical protein
METNMLKKIGLSVLVIAGGFSLVMALTNRDKDTTQSNITISSVDPLVKVLRTEQNFKTSSAVADVARGEYATFQFVLRSGINIDQLKVTYQEATKGSSSLGNAKIGYVGYVKLNNLAGRSSARDQIRSIDHYYPDPILDKAPASIRRNQNQAVWITIPIPAGKAAGSYSGKVIFEGRTGNNAFRVAKDISVNVYNVNITKNTLQTSNWFFFENRLSPPYSKLKYMNDGKDVVQYGPRYWQLMEVVAKNMQTYRQNVLYVSPLRETGYALNNGKYTFDFSNFDKIVSLFKRYGVANTIEGGHIGGRTGGWDGPLAINYMAPDANGIFQMLNADVNSKVARDFHAQFFPALVKHLKAKGWYNSYYQHLIDEPTDRDAENYKNISRLIKGFAPDIKVIDALSTNQLAGNIDVWVPQLEYLAQNADFFQSRIKKGESVWLYTCWLPQGDYANRFVELPLLKNRILPWICFKYNLKGNLNWGYNYWIGDPYANADVKDGESVQPGGDGWMVYPVYGGLQSSIRQESQRDGSFDYELLTMLSKKNPAKARQLAAAMVKSYDNYTMDIPHFRTVRREILKSLSL